MEKTTYDYREKKMVAVLSSKISPDVAINVIGHLSVSVGAYADSELMGRKNLIDSSGISHFGISRYPFIATKVKPAKLRKAIEEARKNPSLQVFDYPIQMLETAHDDELAESLANVTEESLEYLGAIIYGKSSDVDRITGKFTLWK